MNGNILPLAEHQSAFVYLEAFYILLAAVLIIGLAVCIIIAISASIAMKKKLHRAEQEDSDERK